MEHEGNRVLGRSLLNLANLPEDLIDDLFKQLVVVEDGVVLAEEVVQERGDPKVYVPVKVLDEGVFQELYEILFVLLVFPTAKGQDLVDALDQGLGHVHAHVLVIDDVPFEDFYEELQNVGVPEQVLMVETDRVEGAVQPVFKDGSELQVLV